MGVLDTFYKKLLLILGAAFTIFFSAIILIMHAPGKYCDFRTWVIRTKSIVWEQQATLNNDDFKIDPSLKNRDRYIAHLGILYTYEFGTNYKVTSETICNPHESYMRTHNNSIALRTANLEFKVYEIAKRLYMKRFQDSVLSGKDGMKKSEILEMIKETELIKDSLRDNVPCRDNPKFAANMKAQEMAINELLRKLPNVRFLSK